MKNWLLFSLCIVSSITMAQPGVAVVELFTSQGCSSCPAADKLLSAIIKSSQKEGQKIYALSFHVDYWNHLGWKDPYATKEFTSRQYKYAEAMHSQVYTPQMVVNGITEFVGSDRQRLRTSLANALATKPRYEISITGLVFKDGRLTFGYAINHEPTTGEILNVAIVEKSSENEVLRGENAGMTLQHNNVVRLFHSRPLKLNDAVSLDAHSNKTTNLSIILFIQGRELHVCAAAAKDL
jgi:hypothetical protein